VPLAKEINEPSLSIHASDISWSRVKVGKEFAENQNQKISSLAVASYLDLPYLNESFDFIITHYTLEEAGDGMEEAILELYRCTARYLIIIEASYTLGSKLQRNKLRNRRWNLNISKIIMKNNLKRVRHQLVPHCVDALLHGAIHIIEKK